MTCSPATWPCDATFSLSAAGDITNHHGGHLTTEEGRELIEMLDRELGDDRVRFIPGIQYRHLLVIRGGNKHIITTPPHDHPGEAWRPLLVRPLPDAPAYEEVTEEGRMSAAETAALINNLTRAVTGSSRLSSRQPAPLAAGTPHSQLHMALEPGLPSSMLTLSQMYPAIKTGSVITAVDLIRGIGRYAGLRPIDVEGATGLADTNYEDKCRAALESLRSDDFVFLHVEATDEAGHDGDIDLKVKAIEYLDRRVVGPILDEVTRTGEQIAIALLPDHATPVELRVHKAEPVPFTIWHPGITPDSVTAYPRHNVPAGLRHSPAHGVHA